MNHEFICDLPNTKLEFKKWQGCLEALNLTSRKGELVPRIFPQNVPLVRPGSGHKAPGTWDSARRCSVQPWCTRKGAPLHPSEAETGMKQAQDGLVPLTQAEPAPRRKSKGQFPRREQAVAILFC